jgi:transcriptional regulator with XRE-family HTH domain
MRSTSGAQRGTWATLVQAAREAAGLTKAELARRLGVDRGTVLRWESGTNRPENGEVIQRFAALFAIDLDTALAAAGLRPDGPMPVMPEPLHPDIQRLVDRLSDPNTNEETKAYIMSTLRYLADLPPAPRKARKAAG